MASARRNFPSEDGAAPALRQRWRLTARAPHGPAAPAEGGEGDDPEEPHARVPARRLLRWAAVVGALILGVLSCWQDPGYAHDGPRLAVQHDPAGAARTQVSRTATP